MIARIAAAAVLATAMGVVLPTAASTDGRSDVIAVPVLVDFGTYRPANEAILNAIDDRLRQSRLVTPNVDADLALVVKARFFSTKDHRRMTAVAYSWSGKMLFRTSYLCSKAQIGRCSAAIVRGAEKAAVAIRRSPGWLRPLSTSAR